MKRLALTAGVLGGIGLSLATQAQTVIPGNYQGAAGYAAPAQSPADGAIFEVLGRLEQLQSEVQQLRGMVEEQAQAIADLERKQGNMYTDLDGRLQGLATSAPAQPTAQVTVGNVLTASPAPAATAPVSAPPVAAAPAPSAMSNEKERYQTAYDTLRNGHNGQAIQLFEALLTQYPAGEFSDNAQYWLAEAYKINRETDKARAAFGKVVSQYPSSTKVPDALLKLGYIEFEQQNMAKARDFLTRVSTSYPGTTAAHLATKKLAQMP
jgi:tol-pal system protein YbgF